MSIFRIKITLNDIDPPVWRRIEVLGDTRLDKLHRMLQAAMCWEDHHLHQFTAGGVTWGIPNPDIPDDTRNERNVRLDTIASAGETLVYEYDFGDSWIHRLRIEEVLAPEPKMRYPRCTGGARACPPEVCGGPWGYENLLQILGDPNHEEYEETREWAGEDFDPEAFDAGAATRAMRRLR